MMKYPCSLCAVALLVLLVLCSGLIHSVDATVPKHTPSRGKGGSNVEKKKGGKSSSTRTRERVGPIEGSKSMDLGVTGNHSDDKKAKKMAANGNNEEEVVDHAVEGEGNGKGEEKNSDENHKPQVDAEKKGKEKGKNIVKKKESKRKGNKNSINSLYYIYSSSASLLPSSSQVDPATTQSLSTRSNSFSLTKDHSFRSESSAKILPSYTPTHSPSSSQRDNPTITPSSIILSSMTTSSSPSPSRVPVSTSGPQYPTLFPSTKAFLSSLSTVEPLLASQMPSVTPSLISTMIPTRNAKFSSSSSTSTFSSSTKPLSAFSQHPTLPPSPTSAPSKTTTVRPTFRSSMITQSPLPSPSLSLKSVKPSAQPTPAPTINVPSVMARIPTFSPLPHPPSVRQPSIFRNLASADIYIEAGMGRDNDDNESDESRGTDWSAANTLTPKNLGSYGCLIILTYFLFF